MKAEMINKLDGMRKDGWMFRHLSGGQLFAQSPNGNHVIVNGDTDLQLYNKAIAALS